MPTIRMGSLQVTILLSICVSAQMFSVASAGPGTVIVGTPTNDSCVLYAGAVATGIVGVSKQFTIRTQHTDSNGPTDINYVEVTVDVAGWGAVFRWTESTDTFSEQADPSSYFTLSSTSADSSSAGNQWTLDWKFTITSWSTDENSKNVRAYVIDSASLTDQDDYSSVLRVENDLTSASLAVDDYDAVPSQTLTFTGYWYYDSTSVAPPDGDYQVTIKLSSAQKGSTDTTLVSGAFSIDDVTSEATIGSYDYTVEASHMTSSGSFSSVTIGSSATFPLSACLTYDNGASGTGKVCSLDNYTFASAIANNAAGLYFNATGVTLPSNQFQFQAWNTSNTGTIPVTIQTGTVKPSYALNLLNYTYSATTGNVTAYTLPSSQTVTFDFNQLGPASPTPSVSIYYSTLPVSSVSWNDPNRQLTITTTGTGTMKLANSKPYEIDQITMDGVAAGASNWAYDSSTNVLTLIGSTVWVIQYTKESTGPGTGPGSTVTTTTTHTTTSGTSTINTVTIPVIPPSWWDFGWANPSNWPTIGNSTTGFGSQFYIMNPYFELTTTGWITVMVTAVMIMAVAYAALARTNRSRHYT